MKYYTMRAGFGRAAGAYCSVLLHKPGKSKIWGLWDYLPRGQANTRQIRN
jgi:hypothetical protein